MPRIKRITRKELRKNEVFEALQKTILYIKEHPKRIKMGLAIGGGGFLLLLLLNFLIERIVNLPKEELSQAIFSYHYGKDETQLSSGRAQFQSFLSKHKGGMLSDIALLYKGASEMRFKDYATSSETFKRIVGNKNHIISQSALMCLANIEEERKDFKKAIAYYKTIKAKDDYLKGYASERLSKLKKIEEIKPHSMPIGTSSTIP